jgi:hypothetical protein
MTKTVFIPAFCRVVRKFAGAVCGAVLAFSVFSVLAGAALAQKPATGASAGAPERAHGEKTPLELKFIVVDRAGLFPCADAPQEWLEVEKGRVEVEFPLIRKDEALFRAVADHLGLGRVTQFTADEQLLVHCYYRKVQSVWLAPEGEKFRVVLEEDAAKVTGGKGPVTYIDRQGQITTMQSSVAEPSVSRPVREMTGQQETPATAPAPVPWPKLTEVRLRHRLLGHYVKLSYCSPMNPVSSGYGYEQMEKADPEAFAEIRRLLGLGKGPLSARKKQDVLREYETMQSVRVDKLATGSYFALNVAEPTGVMDARVEGTIDAQGRVRELRRTPVSAVCPK